MHVTYSGRRRRTREQIEDVLQRYYESGLTQMDFAKRDGIGLSTLQRWLHQPGRRTRTVESVPPPPTWVEVALPASPPRTASLRSYRLDLPGGASLRIEGGFDPSEVEQLLRVLR